MANNDKLLFCRYCGNCFKSEDLKQHEHQCSQRADNNGHGPKQKKVDDNGQEPEVSKKVLQDEDGVKKTQEITKYPDDGTKKIVTKKTETDEDSDGIKKVVKTETKVVNDDGTTFEKVETTQNIQQNVKNNSQGGLSKENEEALQQLRDLSPDLNLSQISCLHCNEHIPREEYLEHARECRSKRQM